MTIYNGTRPIRLDLGSVNVVFEQSSKTKEPKPTNVVFSGLTTIVFFDDGSKEMVRCGENDVYDPEHAVAMALAHKMFGSRSKFKKFVSEKGHVQMTVEEEQERVRIKKERKDFYEFPF